MTLAKSLLLGSAAGLAAVAGANAADLPARGKVAAVEYVRVCSTYGEGFFYIPGTETCLRIGGRVRAEALYLEPVERANDTIGFRAQGRINLDARTQTAYGALRSYVRLSAQTRSGSPYGFAGTADVTGIDQAFVQFGGFTAGRVTSFFDNPDLPTEHFGTLRFSDAPDVALFAYTFSFGSGFSATLSLEDGQDRESLAPVAYAGRTAPDLVGNVRYAGTWGSAQLSGAIHQTRASVTPTGIVPDTEYGFAVTGQVGVNLPFLGAGDAAWFAATYADAALAYITGGTGESLATGLASGATADVIVDPATGDTSRGRAWSIAGGLTHNWTPALRSSLFGSYAQFEYSEATGFADFDEYRIGANTIWSPVSGLNIGVEVIYGNLDPGSVAGVRAIDDSGVEGRIRVQRDF